MPVDIYAQTSGDALSATELELYHLIMDYRAENGLDAIPLSNLLTATAGRHAQDTLYNIWEPNLALPDGANLHSWSDAPYYSNHSQPQVMWDAPSRLGLDYPSPGFEISAAGYGNVESALTGWKGSTGHDAVIVNEGTWSSYDWNAIGIGVEIDPTVGTYGGRIYHVWFGRVEDATGGPKILGSEGADALTGTAFEDRVYDGLGNDTVELGDGNDYVRVGGGKDSYDGGSGKDYISYYDSSGGITADLGADSVTGSWANNDTIKDFESISGSKTGDDHITGTSGANTIKTYGGDDRVYAEGGSDKVELGSGNDYVKVGGGKESFDGGSGKDYISYYDSSNGIRIDLRDDEVSGSWAVNDTIKDFESASGSKTGDDVMLGTSGSNTLKSYGGDDKLYGRSGDDILSGGDGEDYFDGGHGMDLIWGGDDADVFHFDAGEGDDVIKDFENNVDSIEFDNFGMTKAQVYALATNVGDDVVFDFGADGSLTVEDATRGQVLNDFEVV